MDPLRNLMKKLMTTEHIPFILEMKELMPNLLIEIKAYLFEKHLRLRKECNSYIFCNEDKHLFVVKDIYNSSAYFRFGIFLGDDDVDTDFYWGIKGPWERIRNVEIVSFKKSIKKLGLTLWEGNPEWWFKKFSVSRQSFYNSLRNNQKEEIVMTPLVAEFLSIFSMLVKKLDTMNATILKNGK